MGRKDRTLDRLFRRFRDRNDGAALAAVFDRTARDLLDRERPPPPRCRPSRSAAEPPRPSPEGGTR